MPVQPQQSGIVLEKQQGPQQLWSLLPARAQQESMMTLVRVKSSQGFKVCISLGS